MGWGEYIAQEWIGVSLSPPIPGKKIQTPLYNHPQFSRSQKYIQVSTRGNSKTLGTRISAFQPSRKYLQKYKFKPPFSWSSLHRTMKEGPWKCKSPRLFLPSHKSNRCIQTETESGKARIAGRALSRIDQKCPQFPNASHSDWTIQLHQMQTRNLLSSSQCSKWALNPIYRNLT